MKCSYPRCRKNSVRTYFGFKFMSLCVKHSEKYERERWEATKAVDDKWTRLTA